LTEKEKAEAEERKIVVNKSLIAFDGIAIVANVQNQDSVIGLPVLKKILTGEIKNWDQINSNSPLGAIRVLFEGKESGVLRYVVDSITREDALSSNLYVVGNSSEVLEKVIQMPNAIGMIGFNLIGDESYSDYVQMRDKIRLIWIGKEEQATAENSYLPYAGDILSENYPLWRPVYALSADPRSGLSSGFSIFLAHDVGQKVILKSGLLPVTNPHIMQVAIQDEYPQNTKK
jgi:phosphate transport system substrate-binding protein